MQEISVQSAPSAENERAELAAMVPVSGSAATGSMVAATGAMWAKNI